MAAGLEGAGRVRCALRRAARLRAALRRAAASDRWHETAHARRLPGEGELDLAGILALLGPGRGALPQGPEVCSDALSALPPPEAARRAAAATLRLLDAVDAALPVASG